MNWILKKWQNYWFLKKGFLSIGICRIAVFLSILLTHLDITPFNYQNLLDSQPLDLYQPVGVLKFFGNTPPSASFLESCESVAFVSTWFAIIGLLSRVSMPVSVISNLILVSVMYSWTAGWPHGRNVVFLAGLAFMFAPAGDSLSLDAMLKAWFNQKPFRLAKLKSKQSYQWSIFLAQFAVAFMYANACYWKLTRDNFQFGWVFSDNLRNALAVGWYRSKGNPPAHVAWIMSHEWAWKSLALGNIIAQGTIILACFLVKRPLWRFIFGSLFFFETLGLGIVVGLWNPEWLPLTALFVDWDRFFSWIGRQLKPLRHKLSITVCYDETSGLDNRIMHLIYALDWLRLVNYVPLQSVDEKDLPPGGTIEKLSREIGFVTQGQLSYGFKGYLRLLCRLPLTLPLSVLLSIPPFSFLGNQIYRWLVPNRRSDLLPKATKSVPFKGFRTHFFRGLTSLYILLFSGYYIYTGMTKAEKEHRNYPFSAFTVYSSIRAKEPYHEHATFEYIGSQLDITTTESSLSPSKRVRLNRRYKSLYQAKTPEELQLRLAAVMKDLNLKYKISDVEKLAATKIIWQVPAYPEDHQPIPIHQGLMGILDQSGHFYAVSGEVEKHKPSEGYLLKLTTQGYENPEFRVAYQLNLSGDIKPLAGTFKGNNFYFHPPETGTYNLLIFVKDSLTQGKAGEEQAYFGPKVRFTANPN